MESLEKTIPEKASAVIGPAAKLSPDRMELLHRTLAIRKAIGKVSRNLTDLVRDMRDRGD
jgi:hypothetical protein